MERYLRLLKRLIPQRIFKAMQPAYHFFFSWLAALLFRFPSEKLIIIGVTGTTGKTTSVFMIARTLEANGLKVGYTSTAVFNDGEREWLNDKKMTMIGRFFTQRILRRMIKNNCQAAIVETTSEGIEQFRHRFINFDIVVITGLYEEHIDAHGSFENYKKAKGKLFAHLSRCHTKYLNEHNQVEKVGDSGWRKIERKRLKKTIVANGDDKHADYFLSFTADNKIVYSQRPERLKVGSEVVVVTYGDIVNNSAGVWFKVLDMPVQLRLLGIFNATNAMNAFGVGLALGLPLKQIRNGLEGMQGVAGRLEKIDEGQNFTVIVDYAFEPVALKKLYETISVTPHNKIIHVLGATGGGRDIARRPKLGAIAGNNADQVIITNEDPYDDDPEIIMSQVALGAEKAGKKPGIDLFRILDRREAIMKALALAQESDFVLITGKGSEQAICVENGKKIPWDDRAIVRGILQDRYK